MKPDEDAGERSSFQNAGINCPGDRPWLGEGANESCNKPLVGALINQTNIYFPKTISAILLPDLQENDNVVTEVRNEIEQDPGTCGIARTLWNMNDKSGAVALVQNSLQRRALSRNQAQVEAALEVRRALSRTSWCSADPVCSQNLGGQGSRLANLAACHGCTLLPETSCETINQGLDRGMLVGTPDKREPGWMSDLLEQVYQLA